MMTSNGLDVPTGWGQQPPRRRRPCPVCRLATTVVTNAAGFTVLDEHTRAMPTAPQAGVNGRAQCPGSGRLVTA